MGDISEVFMVAAAAGGLAGALVPLVSRLASLFAIRFAKKQAHGAAAWIGDIDLAYQEVSLEGCRRAQALPAGVP